MSTEKSKLYVGCSLTQASEEFKAGVEAFKDTLRDQNYEVFDFVGLVNGTSEDVYNWDIGHCVKDCDMFVGICDLPSIGLGWESNEALRLGKRVLLVAAEGAKVTRLVLGAADAEPGVRFERYTDLSADITPIVAEMLASTALA